MKLPIGWLRDYLDVTSSSDEIAERLAGLGFPVESIERRPALSGVVVGRLRAVEKHPNADRLQVCTVDIDGAETLTIATAATNVAAGQVVPVALLGAVLAGMTIGPRKMRGIDSEGMLVSAGELGLAEDGFEDGILQLEADAPLGADAIARYGLNGDVLDVEITANRVDAMSVLGLARELGAALGLPVREPATAVAYVEPPSSADASVALESPDCKRFVAQRFSGLTVRPAPFWMRVRLALAGQRPIDNLVDISNFVMLETGQPLHAYDFDKIAGGKLTVRDARPGEKLITLDGEERTLDAGSLAIADDVRVQCLAGLRGAAASEVTSATRELLLEAATFSGPRIRRMAIALGLRTDASSRHEKGLPPALGVLGAARAAHLLELEGARVHAPFAVGAEIAEAAPIALRGERVRALLGAPLTDDEIETALRALGFSVERSGDDFAVTPPAWRGDIALPEDLVEEAGRIAGYDRIVEAVPSLGEQKISSTAYDLERRIAHTLAAGGYREAMSLALQPGNIRTNYDRAGVALPGEVVEIVNPLSEDQRYLRFSLVPGLLALARRYANALPLRFFELGHIFFDAPELVERATVTWMFATSKPADQPEWRDDDFLRFKGESLALIRALSGREADTLVAAPLELHPGKSASLQIDGREVATIGAVDPRLLAAFDVESAVYIGSMRIEALPAYSVPTYQAPSKYPALERDLALIVAPEVGAGQIESAIRAGADGVLAGVRVFDEYRGPQVEAGKKSLAVRVVLQRDDATLTDTEAEQHVAAILAALAERCGAKIRQ